MELESHWSSSAQVGQSRDSVTLTGQPHVCKEGLKPLWFHIPLHAPDTILVHL